MDMDEMIHQLYENKGQCSNWGHLGFLQTSLQYIPRKHSKNMVTINKWLGRNSQDEWCSNDKQNWHMDGQNKK